MVQFLSLMGSTIRLFWMALLDGAVCYLLGPWMIFLAKSEAQNLLLESQLGQMMSVAIHKTDLIFNQWLGIP